MLDSKFFDIIKIDPLEYKVGNYIVTIADAKTHAFVSQLVVYNDDIDAVQAMSIGYISNNRFVSVDGKISMYRKNSFLQLSYKFSRPHCISKDTFNLLLLNYA